MMIQAVLGNPNHPEYGVATIPFPIPRDQYAHCMELLADCQGSPVPNSSAVSLCAAGTYRTSSTCARSTPRPGHSAPCVSR